MVMEENLNEMVKNLNAGTQKPIPSEVKPSSEENPSEEIKEETAEPINIALTNFYDWYESFSDTISTVAQVKAEVSNIDSKDSIIFKIPKEKDSALMELISFYKPSIRPILNLPPVRVKIFKNDTFEVLHAYSQNIFIKSYGVKTGLIIVYCANVDGKLVPYEKVKIKKNITSIKLIGNDGIVDEIRTKLQEQVDTESIRLLYRHADKYITEFTTKESTIDWFLKKQSEVIDINHLLKIDNVLINVI